MWYNNIMVWLLRSPLHGLLSGNMMVINYTGRKSGKAYRLPVSYLRLDDTLLTISFKNRTWWRNLRRGASVTVHLQGKDVSARAEVVEDDQGVVDGLRAFIGKNQQAARMLGVKLDESRQPDQESLRQAAKARVVVLTKLG
jgi:deazaflavin-dependent oxidoreductase (nitroreductase family)